MAEPNPNQLAPGEEAGQHVIDEPYTGWAPSQHVGYSLNESLRIGIDAGRY